MNHNGTKNASFRSGTGKTVQIGYKNRNSQVCYGTRDMPGNDYNQYSYKIKCYTCNKFYGANGSDVFQRKCPYHQGGKPCIPY